MVKKSAYKEHNKINKYLNQESTLRYLWYRTKWNLAPKLKIHTNFPTHLDIETTNTCNLKCEMCPHSKPTAEFKDSLGFMDLNLYKSIIDEASIKGTDSIKLNWRGEPLMHPRLPEMVQYAKEKKILEVMINTNATNLTKQKSVELMNAKLDYIIFSFDAFSKGVYEKIRIGADFQKTRQNILDFLEIKKKLNLRKPLTRIQLVKMDVNKHEIPRFIEFWKNKVDLISIQDYTWRGEGQQKLTSNDTYDGRLACPQLWQRLIITWDGKIIMCCRDWESENIIDNLKAKTITEIWNNERMAQIREMHKNQELDKIPVCKACTLKETYNWVKHG